MILKSRAIDWPLGYWNIGHEPTPDCETIGPWNEWGEGSYIEPYTEFGFQDLEMRYGDERCGVPCLIAVTAALAER